MSEHDKGDQGVQGVQGLQGIQGVRGQGDAGEQGVRGPRGKAARLHPRQAIAFLLIIAAFAVVTYRGEATRGDLSEEVDKNRSARIALCAQRTSLDHKIERTDKLLKGDPKLFDRIFPGIPASVIKDGRRDDKDTLKILNIVECP